MLIATLPPLYQEDLCVAIASHPRVDVLRYNIGMDNYHSPEDTTVALKNLAQRFGKKIWLDLKGRQLRVDLWITPGYSEILLNHEVEVIGEARVHFRGSGWTNLKYADGNRIFVDPLPPQALGKGQSVNIVGDNVKIDGYLTELDREYIKSGYANLVDGFLLSFFEQDSDISDFMNIWGAANKVCEFWPDLILKIESRKGLEFINMPLVYTDIFNIIPMLARDDLYNELGSGPAVLQAAEQLININSEAIAASRLMSGIEKTHHSTVADFADWHLLRQQGYHNFMLSDGLCLRHFTEAMTAIEEYFSHYPEQEKDDG